MKRFQLTSPIGKDGVAMEAEPRHDVSCYVLAQPLGIMGMLDDLPSDLSTNPDHFKGFGNT